MSKFIKNTLLQIISFVIAVIFIGVFASISWNTNTPDGETAGGKYISIFNKIFQSCPNGQVIGGYNTTGDKICIIYN